MPETTPANPKRIWNPLNTGLALAALGLGVAQLASANQPASRGPGQYVLIGGEINRGDSNGVYVIDTVNRDMVLLRWTLGARGFEGLGYRSFPVDLGSAPTR